MSDKPDLEVQEGYDDLPYAEVRDGDFKQVQLSPEEADVMGNALMNLIQAGFDLKDYVDELADDSKELSAPLEERIKAVVFWAVAMQENVQMQTAKAGLGMIP